MGKRLLYIFVLLLSLLVSCRGKWLDEIQYTRSEMEEVVPFLINAHDQGLLISYFGEAYTNAYYKHPRYQVNFSDGSEIQFGVIHDVQNYNGSNGERRPCVFDMRVEWDGIKIYVSKGSIVDDGMELTFPYTNNIFHNFPIGSNEIRHIGRININDKSGFGAQIVSNTMQHEWGVITFDNSVTKIGAEAFSESQSSIILLPYRITEIGARAFYDCNRLKQMILPAAVEIIGNEAFASCAELSEVYCKAQNPPLVGEMIFDKDKIFAIYVPAESVEAYKTAEGWSEYADSIVGYDFEKGVDIPNTPAVTNNKIRYTTTDGSTLPFVANSGLNTFGAKIVSNTYENGVGILTFDAPVSKISSNAFMENHLLKSIELPQSTTQFGSHAFCDCINLESVNIPSGVTQIGVCAFSGCRKLNDITLPEGLSVIETQTFAGCLSLTNITIPASVVEIEEQAFYSCNAMREVYCKPSTPPSTTKRFFDTWESFSGCFDATIYVPTESVEAYKTAEDWSEYADSIVGYDF